MSNVATNYFQLLQLPLELPINTQLLQQQYHTLQLQVHPDRHMQSSQAERHAMIQASMSLNEAYRVLRDPMLAATHLLAIHGMDIADNTATSPAILMATMEAQEELSELDNAEDIQWFLSRQQQEIQTTWQQLYQQCAAADWHKARDSCILLRFLETISRDAKRRFIALK